MQIAPLAVRLPKSDCEAVRAHARASGQTVSSFVADALRHFLADYLVTSQKFDESGKPRVNILPPSAIPSNPFVQPAGSSYAGKAAAIATGATAHRMPVKDVSEGSTKTGAELRELRDTFAETQKRARVSKGTVSQTDARALAGDR